MQRLVGGTGKALSAQVIWLTRVRYLSTVKKAAQSSHPLSPIHFCLSLLSPKLASQHGSSPLIACQYRSIASKASHPLTTDSVTDSDTYSICGISLDDIPDDTSWTEFLSMAKIKGAKKGGRGRGGKKAKKDPNAPKRSLSAYMFFANEVRDIVREENPEAKFGQIGKLLGERWKSLSPEDKGPYDTKAAADKKRYEDEKAMYQERQQNDEAEEEKEEDEEEDEE